MGGGPITKEHVKKLIKKLHAVNKSEKGAAHEQYAVYYETIMVASFGVRHSPNRDMPHPHIPNALRVNERYVKDMASCTKSREDWLKKLGYPNKKDEEKPEESSEQ